MVLYPPSQNHSANVACWLCTGYEATSLIAGIGVQTPDARTKRAFPEELEGKGLKWSGTVCQESEYISNITLCAA